MEIGGKKREVAFNMNTWIEYCEMKQITITQLGESLKVLADGGGTGAELRDLVYCALKEGARKKKQAFDHDNYDVGEWLTDVKSDQLAVLMEQMASSMDSGIEQKQTTKKKRS